MSADITQPQGGQERSRARELSLKRGHPPTPVPGYEPERFLGAGAYGEVWVEIERNTGRRVAIKFYAHRGGLDWSLLSREVEKLAFLFADRYVVQLLGVGWDAEPPYYIMEYIEKGSLAERIQRGPLPVDEAVELFRDVAIGLVHAHAKGVLHCDLKPANILLDQDGKPRLADFGQSRLSHEQIPALGTLFYMAPEQADLAAVPDVGWDVYALGALLYCMLTGGPPHRSPDAETEFETGDLEQRLARYRELIVESPPPAEHRRVRGVDRMLADIIDRCLAVDPRERFPNVQAVLDALGERAVWKARMPLMVLGAIGPMLLLAVVAWFAWHGFTAALKQSDAALTSRAVESNEFAAQYVAKTAANELERRFDAVEQVARDPSLRAVLNEVLAKPEFVAMLERVRDAELEPGDTTPLQEEFRNDPNRLLIEDRFSALIPDDMRPDSDEASSWFFCDVTGLSTTRVPAGRTLGWNFAWRSYFHGGPRDEDRDWRPPAGEHLKETTLSAVFRSQATSRWLVAISAPVFDGSPERRFLGVVAMTIEVGRLVELRQGEHQFATLVDRREGDNQGVILQHPLYDRLLEQEGRVPDRFQHSRVSAEQLPSAEHPERQTDYRDPLASDPAGHEFDRHWLAQSKGIKVRGKETGMLVIVQEAHDTAIGQPISRLSNELIYYGLLALALVVVLMLGLWVLAMRMTGKPTGT